MKKLQHDGVGYVSGKGASKYWGVTTSKVNGRKIWIVNAKEHGHRGQGFDLSELDAAIIASWYYDNFVRRIIPTNQTSLQSFDGEYLLNIRPAYYEVHRTKITKPEAPKQQTVFDLVENKEETGKQESTISFWANKKVPSERELLAVVTDMVLKKMISPTAARLLHNILEEAV